MLSPAEKQFGRAWRDRMRAEHDARLRAGTWTYLTPAVIRVLRHRCPARADRSHSIDLREHYRYSPPAPGVASGRFGWLWREGQCRQCGQSALSEARLVDATVRPPLDRATHGEGVNDMSDMTQQPAGQQPAGQQAEGQQPARPTQPGTQQGTTPDDATEKAASAQMQADTEAAAAESGERMGGTSESK